MTACSCSEKQRPFKCDLPAGSNDRPRQWFVTRRNFTRSAFNGGVWRYSDSSDIHCRVCRAYWRTKAKWISKLDDCEYFPRSNPPAVEPYEGTIEL